MRTEILHAVEEDFVVNYYKDADSAMPHHPSGPSSMYTDGATTHYLDGLFHNVFGSAVYCSKPVIYYDIWAVQSVDLLKS